MLLMKMKFLWEGLQQFKGTLITNSEDEVTIKLRARQNRKDMFHRDKFWNIEKISLIPTLVDSSKV